jgi:plasmid stabilization system protein ParE
VKLVWSAFALSDRDDIFTHIEADNGFDASGCRRVSLRRPAHQPPVSASQSKSVQRPSLKEEAGYVLCRPRIQAALNLEFDFFTS